jgi:PAS domain S-box-containing protein
MADKQPDPPVRVFSHEELELLCMRQMLADTDERIFFKDRDGRFLLVSHACLKTHGQQRKLEDLIGTKDSDFFTGPHADEALADERRVMETGEPMLAKVERETFHDRPDAWAQTSKLPLRDEDGNIIGTWGTARDITAQIQAEQALAASREELAASERMHRVLFEQNPQPTFIYDRSTMRFIAVNDAAQEIYGYSREELLELSITDLIPEEDHAEYLRSLQPQSEEGLGFRRAQARRHRYKDGTVVEVEVTSNDVVLDGRACRIASTLDVTERNRAAAELAAARDAAVEASNMKSAFLANISHEVRTPMNGVLGMTQLLLDSPLNADQRSLAEHLASSGELMVGLINEILDISKIEAGQLQLELNDFSLRESIATACAATRPQAVAKGVDLVQEIDPALPSLSRGDGRRLHQILLNLIVNAVKFTSEGRIVVRATVGSQHGAASTVRIEVIDTGIGIEASQIENMFEPFTQADASTTRKYGGTGLGLAISRELIELMGGTIGATSEPGSGSTFWIELLLHEPATTPGGPLAPLEARGAVQPQWSTAPFVLVVEDSPVNQIVVVRTLERCGCRTDIAHNGRQALEMLAKQHYDAVLMDCQMPEMDGYEATAALRARENGGPRTPVIAMTAHAMQGDREQCLDAGMDDYLSKPIQRDWLIDTLRRWLPPTSDDAADGN